MKSIIPVDIFGKCTENETLKYPRDSKEEKEFLSKYKFYIAFENSRCPNYVTEKLYKVLNLTLSDNPPVPVVMGPKKSWYEENLPYNSFIHVDDYKSPEELAKYLLHQDTNNEEYLTYLNWRRNYQQVCEPRVRCRLCEFLLKRKSEITNDLHKEEDTYPAIADFKSFWQKAKCYD